jgi:hypothetical protein
MPASRQAVATVDPMYPAPPVINTFIGAILSPGILLAEALAPGIAQLRRVG